MTESGGKDRRQPRRRSTTPVLFGVADSLIWKPAASLGDEQRNEAARLQHAFAVAIRRGAQARFGSVKAYAAASGTPYDHLARTLRGAAPLSIEVIAEAETRLGGIYAAAFSLLRPSPAD